MQIKFNTIHIWAGSLDITEAQAVEQQGILSIDERDQASRFKFPIHRLRYIAAHHQLRHILSFCIGIPANEITFGYSEHRKPHITNTVATQYQFNISHSDNRAVYAIGLNYPLGIDIEKVRNKCNMDIADRFFSETERDALSKLNGKELERSFYRVWSRKEAIIKATGKGLSQQLSSFSVAVTDVPETIIVDNQEWKISPLSIDSEFQSALAYHPSIEYIMMESIADL
jgi:4'-phosphopantetheinyl transferase